MNHCKKGIDFPNLQEWIVSPKADQLGLALLQGSEITVIHRPRPAVGKTTANPQTGRWLAYLLTVTSVFVCCQCTDCSPYEYQSVCRTGKLFFTGSCLWKWVASLVASSL